MDNKVGEVVWNGRESLVEPIERDYAAMPENDGWDIIYRPPCALTTPWRDLEPWARPDPDQHVHTVMAKRQRRRRVRLHVDAVAPLPVVISQVGRNRHPSKS